jgi:hypothetical protein
MINIQNLWKDFEGKVLAKNAPAIQRREMKRAFVAGISAMLAELSDLSVQDESRAAESLIDVARQCVEFSERVSMGVE